MGNNDQFSGSWAVILGGSSGFGLAALEKLARHRMNVAVLYRETVLTERPLLKTLAAIALEQDVCIEGYNLNALTSNGRDDFIKRFTLNGRTGTVRLLLHSIARGNLKPLASGDVWDEEDRQQTLTAEDIQLTTYAMSNSLLDWTRLLLSKGLFKPDARVIGLTSEGVYKYWESYAAVAVAKASLQTLCTYMAVEFCKFGIRTNIIQAGVTATPSLKLIKGSEKLLDTAALRNPMGRMTVPKDVADVIYLLCTDEAAWINGAVIHADGGEHCR